MTNIRGTFGTPAMRSATFFAGFLWGLAGFGLIIVDQFSISDTPYRVACIGIGSFLAMHNFTRFRNTDGSVVLLFFFYIAILFFASMSSAASFSSYFRELLLLVAVVLICSISNQQQALTRYTHGVLAALFLILIYLFFHIEFSRLLSPLYRLDAGVGSNAIGFYASIGLFFSVSRAAATHRVDAERVLFSAFAIMSATVLIACKSRTALVALLVVYLFMVAKKRPKLAVVLLAVGAALMFVQSDLIDSVLRLSPIDGISSERNITNFTGRTWVWAYGLQLFYESPLIGHGIVFSGDAEAGGVNFHNAFLNLLVTSGIIGAIPIFAIVTGAAITFLKMDIAEDDKSHGVRQVLIFTFGVGLLSAFLENRLLNYGNPASLIFLISIIVLFKDSIVRGESGAHLKRRAHQ